MIGRVTRNFQMTFHTRQNPHGGEKSLSTFEKHQGSASSVSFFFLLDPIRCQNSQPPHRSGFCLIFFTWSQVEPWCDQHCAVPPGIQATQPHFQKIQVTRTTILTRLCRSHCQRKDRSQFPSYGIIKGNSFWVFAASTELWGCERQAALYCHSCSCTKEAVPLFCCRKPYQSDLGFWGPFFLILLISYLDTGGTQGAASWL